MDEKNGIKCGFWMEYNMSPMQKRQRDMQFIMWSRNEQKKTELKFNKMNKWR